MSAAHGLTINGTPRQVVLVEGESDKTAIETLAGRLGRHLEREGIAVVAMGGATNIRRYLQLYGPEGAGLALAGLCDRAEEDFFQRGLEEARLGTKLDRASMEALGFFVCVEDLEDELIRALGVAHLEDVIASAGEIRSLRSLQNQPAQRERPLEAQLRRFFGSQSGRKSRYAKLIVEVLEPSRIPPPLAGLLTHLG
ncbi:MAG: ATP-dependent endonuclease [Acidimicrobiia bacterium]